MVIVTLFTMASLPSSMRRHLRHCWTSVIALVAHCQAGVVAFVVMVPTLSMRRHLCCCYNCDCCPCDDGIVANVNAQASLPLLNWCCCSCNNGIVAFDPLQYCCPCHDGVVAVLKLAFLPLSQWHCHNHQCHHPHYSSSSSHCCRQCAGIFAIVAMAFVALIKMVSLPLLVRRHVSTIVNLARLLLLLIVKLALSPTLRWCYCYWCAGFLLVLQLQLSPSWLWHCCHCWCTGILAIVKLETLPL